MTDYGSDDDRNLEEGEIRSPAVVEQTLDREDQHARLHDFKNTVIYNCRRCGDNYASQTEMKTVPRCMNCRTDRVKLSDNVVVDGFYGLHPLFCCPTCHHHWIMKGGGTSRCKICQNKNLTPPLIKPCMFGIGWMINRFLGRTTDAPFHSRAIPTHSSSSYSYDFRRSNGRPYPARATPPKVCLGHTSIPLA